MTDAEFHREAEAMMTRIEEAIELWVAAKSGGYHYALREGQWRNTQSHAELLADLARFAATQAGAPVGLSGGA